MYLEKFELEELCEGAVMLDGFDDAIIGIVESFGVGNRVLYSKEKILKILYSEGMSNFEAEDYYNYNILGLYGGEQNPLFLIHQ